MTIGASGGQLSGEYYSAVGDAKYEYELAGRYNTQPASGGQSCAWAVAWTNPYGNAHSSTGWTGQYQTDEFGEEEIYTLWLLASEMSPQNDWQSTRVGQDTFTRIAPLPEVIKKARRRGHSSVPVSLLEA